MSLLTGQRETLERKTTARVWAVLRASVLGGLFLLPMTAVTAQTAEDAPVRPSAVTGEPDETLELVLSPSHVVLGAVDTVRLEIRSSNPSIDRPLRGSVNVGELGAVSEDEDGLFRMDYRPPETRFPQVAIIALWRESGPDASVAFFRLPLRGTARLPVQTRAGAAVTVTVDGRDFGPYTTGSDGRVDVRVVVPPGVGYATVRAVSSDGEATSQGLDLPVPPYNRLTMAVLPHSVFADGSSMARLYVYYDGGRGSSGDEPTIEIAASEGGVMPPMHEWGPLHQSYYVPSPGLTAAEVSFEARVEGDEASLASASLSIGEPVPTNLSVRFDREAVSMGADDVLTAAIEVRDHLGLGVEGLPLDVKVDPPEAVESVSVEELTEGTYSLELTPAVLGDGHESLLVLVSVHAGEAVGQAAFRLVTEGVPPSETESRHRSARDREKGASSGAVESFVAVVSPLEGSFDPAFALHVRGHLARGGPAHVSAGVWTGLRAGPAPIPVSDGGTLRSPISIPVMLEMSVDVSLGPWLLGAGAGAGLLLAPAADPCIQACAEPVVRAMGGRLFIGRSAGPGHVSLGLSLIEATQSHRDRDSVFVRDIGGVTVAIGYLVSL